MPTLFALPPPDPGFEIVISRPGMSQGLAQTERIQVFPRAFVRLGGARIGAQWRNVDSPSANGVAAFFLKAGRRIGKVQLDAGAMYRIRTGAKGSSASTAWEFSLGARRDFGKLGLRLNADYSPREFANGPSLYVELGSAFDVGKSKVSVNVGRRERSGEPDYTSFNAGISRIVEERLSLDLRYYMTNRVELGPRYRERIVLSARLTL